MDAIRSVQTAFRLEEGLLRRLEKKAQVQNKSLNRYVEELFLADVRDEPEYPVVSFPVRHADCVPRHGSWHQSRRRNWHRPRRRYQSMASRSWSQMLFMPATEGWPFCLSMSWSSMSWT